MSSSRHICLSSKLWYRGLGLRNRRRFGLISNARSRGLNNTSLIPTIKSSSRVFTTNININNGDIPLDKKHYELIPDSLKLAAQQMCIENDKEAFKHIAKKYIEDDAFDAELAFFYGRRTFGKSQQEIKLNQRKRWIQELFDEMFIYGPSPSITKHVAEDVLSDDNKWKSFLDCLSVDIGGKGKTIFIAVNGIASREALCDLYRKVFYFMINKNCPMPMQLNEAPSGVGKTTILHGLLNGLTKTRDDMVAAIIPMNRRVTALLSNLYESGDHESFDFITSIEKEMRRRYPNNNIKYIYNNITGIEQINCYPFVSKLFSELESRLTDVDKRIEFGTWDLCGSSSLSSALLTKNEHYFSTFRGYGEVCQKLPTLTNCASIEEFKVLYQAMRQSQNELQSELTDYEWLIAYWLTGGHPDSMHLLITYGHDVAARGAITRIDYIKIDCEYNEQYDAIMKQVCTQYWSFWYGIGKAPYGGQKSCIPHDVSYKEFFEKAKENNIAWIDPTRAVGLPCDHLQVDDAVLRRMQDSGMIIMKEQKVFPAFPYFALFELKKYDGSYCKTLCAFREEVASWILQL